MRSDAMAWYAAHAIMYFQLKDGKQDGFRVWENIFLIEAADATGGYAKACEAARRDEGDDGGSLRVGDQPATLVFGGIRKLVSVCHERADGQIGHGDEITYSEFVVADREALQRLIDDEDTDVEYIGNPR